MNIVVGNNTGSTLTNTVSNPSFTPVLDSFQVTSEGSTTVATETWVINESAYSFIRARSVVFKAEGLKPNTRYYPFFDGVFVGQFCSTQDGVQQSNLVTNPQGSIVGTFYIPAGTFTVGTHTFRLVDNIQTVSGAIVQDPIYGTVEAAYEAKGVLKQLQTQVTTTNFDPKSVEPVNITLAPIFAASTPAGLTAPRPAVCESWFFEYDVLSTRTFTFNVTTSSSTAPENPTPNVGSSTVEIIPDSVTFLNTTVTTSGLYSHTYSYRVPTKVSYRQEWIGRSTDNRPNINTFRPTGILPTDVVRVTKQWTKSRNVACPAFLQIQVVQVDPLAQSFFIEPILAPDGAFATSINVYFRSVDQSTPVTLELRSMVNGLPGPDVLPGGRVVLPGYACGQSIDATIATTFVFDHPIYLQANTEYCFVLKSSSLGYNAWCSRLGDNDVTTNKKIDSQPYSGVLFKSANDSTWQPDSYEDIKFDLNVAVFNTSQTGDVVFRPQTDPNGNYYHTAHTLPLAFISTVDESSTLTVKIPLHGMVNGDSMSFGPIVEGTYNNISTTVLSNQTFQVTVVDEDHVTIDVSPAVADATGPLKVQDLFGTIDTIPAIMPIETTIVSAERVINSDNNSPSTVPGAGTALTVPTAPTTSSAFTFTVYANVLVNEILIDYMGTELTGTGIEERIKIAAGQSPGGDEIPYAEQAYVTLPKSSDYYSFEETRLISSKENETVHNVELGSQPSLTINMKLNSVNQNLSPVIDTSGMSLVVKTYDIDNQGGEIDALLDDDTSTIDDFNDPLQNSEINHGSGTAAAKYKGRILRNDQFANSAFIFVSGNCPSPAVIDCYIRTSTDITTHVDRDWEWVPLNGVFKAAFNNSPNKSVINEWMYEFNTTDKFNVYDVKLVMRSTNSSVVPKIYGVRTITNLV